MSKQLFLAVGCLALLTIFTSAAMADHVTFTLLPTGFPSQCISSTTLSCGVNSSGTVEIMNSHGTFILPAGSNALIASSNGTYTPSLPLFATAMYAGSSALEVDVATSLGGICGASGLCLTGVLNHGPWIGFNVVPLGGVGSFSGIFTVTSVSTDLLAFIGDPGQHAFPTGSDSFTSTDNVVGATSTVGDLGSGQISIQTFVPEPTSLALLGTAILGVAVRIRRKR